MNIASLAPSDIQTICRVLSLPLPTPDITLLSLMEQSGVTPSEAMIRLEHRKDIPSMVAASALRSGVIRLPRDPRLSPKPYPKSPVRSPRTDAERQRVVAAPVAPRRVLGTRVLVHVAPNPKRPGSASRDRYALYQAGLTEAQLIERGVLSADLRWDTEREFLRWSEKS